MIMDPSFDHLSFSIDDFNFQSHGLLPDPNQSSNISNGFGPGQPGIGFGSLGVPLLPPDPDALSYVPAISIDDLDGEMDFPAPPDGGLATSSSAGKDSPSSSEDSSDPVLKFISQILMEENMEDKAWVFPYDSALLNTEKSLYDVLGENYPGLPDQSQYFDWSQFIDSPSPDSNISGSGSDQNSVGTVVTNTNSSNSVDPHWLHDPGDYKPTTTPAFHPLDGVPQSNIDDHSYLDASSFNLSNGDASGSVDASVLLKNIFSSNDSVLQFQRGLEEARKFLPPSSQLVVNVENGGLASGLETVTSGIGDSDDKGEVRDGSLSGSRGRKNHNREDVGSDEERATKQSASYVESEESELSDMLDKVLLCIDGKMFPCSNGSGVDASKESQPSAPIRASNGGRGRGRRGGNRSSVDLRTLLILCAQAISSNDVRTASELLKQIRENSSPSGDGTQRLAHYFANGLEARLAGNVTGTQSFFTAVACKRRSVADMLKAYQLHISSCPFKLLSIFYMNYMIWKLSEKADVLHIIDFGIGLGFQWPILIQKLGQRPGGPPKLRMTGIEYPQPGFRPAECNEEAGRRLGRYCERFNVPFEYNAVPSLHWETIRIEDLKIRAGEMVAVNCRSRFSNVLDETIEEDCPRDAVLNLIRRMNPDVFVHTVTNGSYNAPFFVTRFREALFHLSSIYDMLDVTIAGEHRDSEERTVIESEFYGRSIMNVIACEGSERVERPETYKQWQVRHARAGFKQLPVEQEVMKKLRHKLEDWYHKDFVLDEDGNWMLLGWKGRIACATTCWVPS